MEKNNPSEKGLSDCAYEVYAFSESLVNGKDGDFISIFNAKDIEVAGLFFFISVISSAEYYTQERGF